VFELIQFSTKVSAILMSNRRQYRQFCLETLKGRDHSEDLDVDGRIILKLVLRK